ncbi:hypothetical protein EMPS_08549 [Entomortierella parvispora]|uniref:VLRF1 domain-containing protein n=1 Tax=Entomortierella parvispora TaxID=205924 RepID=A0A9P3HGK5_9FUNG|nr:hypothetical protein EMPS_08549 [Entomortierella parvispora]
MSVPTKDADMVTKATMSEPPSSLSLFFLPRDLISTLVPESQTEASLLDASSSSSSAPLIPHTTARPDSIDSSGRGTPTSVDSAIPSCRICGIAQFDSVEKQREHVKLDWHRYNLKQQLLDKRAGPISEQQFESILQDLSSISGSDQDDDDDDSNNDSDAGSKSRTPTKKVAAAKHQGSGGGDDQEALIRSLMKKLELTVRENQQARNQDPLLLHQQQVLEEQLQEARMSPMLWFTSTQYPDTVRLGVYKNALPNKGQTEDILQYLQSLQIAVAPTKKSKNRRAKREAALAAAEAATSDGNALVAADASKVDAEAQDDDEDDEEDEVDTERDWIRYQMQAKQKPDAGLAPATNKPRYWTLIMIGGGHFAGVVMDLAGQVSSHGRDMKVVAHKTFHRYTVRKKQGGSQAAHGVANSAGARIRMYNEEALKTEVRELLDSWSQWIQQSECVFVHSPGGNNRRVLFYDSSVLSAAERQGRLRSIPFMTRRPTLSELKRAYQELSSVKISVLTRHALEQMEQAEQQALEKAIEASHAKSLKDQDASEKKSGKKENAVPSAPAEVLKLVELVKKGRTEALAAHLTKHALDPSQLLPITTSSEYDARRTPTILHLAAHHGQPQVVKLLLEKFRADPTTTTVSAVQQSESQESSTSSFGTSSMTAYDVAKDKETRNAFRRAMALMPDTWDWVGLAHVPSALTPEMEAEQERKAKEKTRKLLDAERERKKTREANRPTTPVQNQRPGSSSASPNASSSGTFAPQSIVGKNLASASASNSHLTPELRMRLERERRAAAAEARMAAMRQTETVRRAVQEGKNVCVACGKSLDGLTPFDKFGRKFCRTDCVAKGPA